MPTAAGSSSASASTGSSTGSTAGSSPVAARPAVLPLDAVMPCELVTAPMRGQFKIDRPERPFAEDPNAPGCTFITTAAGQYVVAVARNKGVDALGWGTPTSLGGFPAVELRRSDLPGVCHLSIDVADGQRLDVQIQRLGNVQPMDEICRDTRAFAEAVLATLRQKLGR